MNIYLAGRFSRHPEMRAVRNELVADGHKVTSRWIDLHGGDQLESATAAALNTFPDALSVYAEHDLEDIDAADVVISFTDERGGGKGGRHVEFGYALAVGKRVMLVGPRENVFHCLPPVEHHTSLQSVRHELADAWLTGGTADTQCGVCGWQRSEHWRNGAHPEPYRLLCGSCDAGLTTTCICVSAPRQPIEPAP